MKYLKKKNIHTCVDTNGFYLTDEVKECIQYTDFFLPDIKQIDSIKHQKLTGFTNEMPLEFIKYIDQEKKNYWIRYVVLPGYTDDEKDLKKL
ncbi:radical SAM protein [bacterium]|nr:radical SAM protein [bacterium]